MASFAEEGVTVVGGGPVGLTLAVALAESGRSVTVLEARRSPRPTSRAIGITPASLEIFQRYRLAAQLCERGIPVRRAWVHDREGNAVEASFETLPSDFTYVLSIPQVETERVLEARLTGYPSVEILRGTRLVALEGGNAGVTAVTDDGRRITSRFLCGCDGKWSTVRGAVTRVWRGRVLSESFVMGDFEDRTDLGEDAHLFFTPQGSLESFPLPGGTRRWIAQTRSYQPDPQPGLLEELVLRRGGFDLCASRELWRSSFETERRQARRWARPPLFLAGDAAHLMPPIGGQGMNVGIGDAEHLADLITLALREPERTAALAREYERRRRAAFAVAAGRSVLGMKVGTASGWFLSPLRDRLVGSLLSGSRAPRLMEHFSMLSSPFRRSPWGSEPTGVPG
ncbi:MAG: FAD-dependent oxidoreductase [Alkalispirochaetaceae bacterium]